MSDLTTRQQEVFDWIKGYISDNGLSPSAADIAIGFGFKSENSSVCHLDNIEDKGYIRRTPGIHRSIVITDRQDKGKQ